MGILEQIMEMHRLKKIIFLFCMYKMVVFTAQNYTKAGVHTVTVGDRKLFRIKMNAVQEGSDVKNIFDLVRKEI